MHAVADTGVPNRICPQKETLASTVDCPTGPNPVDFLCVLSHYALLHKSEEWPKAMGLPRMNGCACLSSPSNQEAEASTFHSLLQASV